MNESLILRAAQKVILEYEAGRMAVSAVPGSGKTFTLSLLASKLIAEGHINPAEGQQVLIVTYLNSSVDTFKARIRRRLTDMKLPDEGYDVRTLHSLALEIMRWAGDTLSEELRVLDEPLRRQYLAAAVDSWIADYGYLWEAFLPDQGRDPGPQLRARWREITERTAGVFISTAKNERYHPEDISQELRKQQEKPRPSADDGPDVAASPLLHMLVGIYDRYQTILARQGALDYDDLIWQAVDRLEFRSDLGESLRRRWPFVLEDEAQDSVPLQEVLLQALVGPAGNWVRVGDPNQAITSSFTAAHPRFFNDFIDRPDVLFRTLPNSGRSAPTIIGAANAIVHWTLDQHPVPEVRLHTFRRQDILPTPPGDAQPNPPDSPDAIRIRVFRHREDEELPGVASLAWELARREPHHTLAILTPTNQSGYAVAEHLDALDADYDNLLRGSSREREVAATLHSILALLADPLSTKALQSAHAGLYALRETGMLTHVLPGTLENPERFHALLRSIYAPEIALFPREDESLVMTLPAGVVSDEELQHLEQFTAFLNGIFGLRSLPVDDLTLALADELFGRSDGGAEGAHELNLAIAYQIAGMLRQWREAQPDWRLPELVSQLQLVVSGQRTLNLVRVTDLGYEPTPGRITLATQHSAKGLEWDSVFLVGIDGLWIPGSLEAPFLGVHDFLGGDPTAEATAQLNYLMRGEAGIYPGRSATDSAHIEVISERLRLLYVGITRARRRLTITRSRVTRQYNKEREAEPATVMGVLYRYIQSRQQSEQ